jgi:hypothetical protein
VPRASAFRECAAGTLRFLADGLPPFGQDMGGLRLLEIPPMDLGHGRVFNGGC